MLKDLLSAVAIALTFMAYLPYIRAIRRGRTRPHVFSWIIWGSTTVIAFTAQLSGGGGIGAGPIGLSGLMTLYVALLAYLKRGDRSITPVDWLFLAAAMSALPVWAITADALWAVVILTLVDLLGFGPTVRKAHAHPHEEQLAFFAIMMVRNVLSAIALEQYSATTLLFPVAIAAACALFIPMVWVRRRQVQETKFL
jgi:hypothetical protein